MRPRVRVEEEVGRGEAVGAVWALTGGIHDTTALCVRDSELVRMSKVMDTLRCMCQPLWAVKFYCFIACVCVQASKCVCVMNHSCS